MGVDGDQDTSDFQPIFDMLLPKMRLTPGLCPTPRRGLPASAPSWQTLGLTIAEAPTELRAPGPQDHTIRHCPV